MFPSTNISGVKDKSSSKLAIGERVSKLLRHKMVKNRDSCFVKALIFSFFQYLLGRRGKQSYFHSGFLCIFLVSCSTMAAIWAKNGFFYKYFTWGLLQIPNLSDSQSKIKFGVSQIVVWSLLIWLTFRNLYVCMICPNIYFP